ncbi:conserved hypothetical protein [Deferribacter desulfuricans SSM1]|uniref:Flagellar protein n=1 Tax=Deferribacter desulfuricans (strain DSM 14783 / JCM 11476 / NBRC 101012 / SSM1) TaxID=639282 RepID=D3P8Y1_DEFDS|nr:hypothetical protein [Deferribacter desulfuricans]BAI81171.1 conserved hypothetical protein [Deferribacter desulfuricans SSM1]
MNKVIFVFLFCIISSLSYSFNYDVNNDSLVFKLKVVQGSKIVTHYEQDNKIIYQISATKGEIVNKEFLGLPVSYIKTYKKNGGYFLEIDFVKARLNPLIKVEDGYLIGKIDFASIPLADNTVKDVNPYLRIIIGLIIIIVLILIGYKFLNIFYRKRVISDIPGVGSLLGKMDIMPGVTLFFVDMEKYIYVLGYSNAGITNIDRITDEKEIVRIRSGFSKKKDFSSYLRFFGKKISKEEVEITKSIVKEKVESLRKK